MIVISGSAVPIARLSKDLYSLLQPFEATIYTFQSLVDVDYNSTLTENNMQKVMLLSVVN